MKPFFSIIIPCCDVEPYVRECLDSVLKQPFADWECIAVVETSKDKTEEIVREYAAKDSRISVFTQPRSGSPAAPRNTALEHATGEYVIFLDSDDMIAEGALQRLHDKIAANPGADLYPCAIQVENEITGRSEPVRDNYPADLHGELTGPEATRVVFLYRRDPCPMLQLTLCRRAFLDENKLRCVPGLRREDSEFSPRALYLAKRVVPLHEPFYIYRIRANSIITAARDPGRFLKDYAVIGRSNLAFHAKISQEPGFDRRISPLWAKKMAELDNILLVLAESDTPHLAKGQARNAGGPVQGRIRRLRSACPLCLASEEGRRPVPENVRAASVDWVARRCVLPMCLPSAGRSKRRSARRGRTILRSVRSPAIVGRRGVTSRMTTFPAGWSRTPWRLQRNSVQDRR